MIRLSTLARTASTAWFLAAALTGCVPSPHDQAVKTARSALASGDLTQAALRFADACHLEPEDKESCDAGNKATSELGRVSFERATIPCEAGEIQACASALESYRLLRPTDVAMRDMLGKAAGKHIEHCETLEKPGSLMSTLARARCVVSVQKLVHDARYDSVVTDEREHAAHTFVDARPGVADRVERNYAFAETARCLASKVQNASEVAALGRTLIDTTAIPIAVTARSVGAVSVSAHTLDLCGSVANFLGPRARCDRKGPDGFRLNAELALAETEHSVSEEVKIARYVSGTERYPNPARPSAERAYYSAKEALQSIEQDTQDRRARCQNGQSPSDCQSYNAAVSVYNSRNQEVNSAEQKMRNTPITLQRDIIAEVPYTVRHHSWATPFAVDLRPADGGKGVRLSGVLRDQDTEHPGVSAANIAGDPLEPPTRAGYEARVRQESISGSSELLAARFSALAACANDAWDFDKPALQCRVTSDILAKGDLPTAARWLPGLVCE